MGRRVPRRDPAFNCVDLQGGKLVFEKDLIPVLCSNEKLEEHSMIV